VPLSFIPGFIDLASVGVIARLMAALVGHRLEDRIPGVKVFGGDSIDQSLWLILQFFQQCLTARVWIDLSNRTHANVLAQKYEYHLSRSTAKHSALRLSHVKRISSLVINPLLKTVGCMFSILLLSIGILVIRPLVGGGSYRDAGGGLSAGFPDDHPLSAVLFQE
jgi:ATP-binding cassette subfamily B protein